MGKELMTPLGEIQIYIDDIRSDYEYEPYCNQKIRSLRERVLAGSYRIVISKKDWQTIRCVVSLCDPKIPNRGSSGERYLCSEFVKENVVVTIGAGDEIPEFVTNQILPSSQTGSCKMFGLDHTAEALESRRNRCSLQV